jgi:hypothetical protein
MRQGQIRILEIFAQLVSADRCWLLLLLMAIQKVLIGAFVRL